MTILMLFSEGVDSWSGGDDNLKSLHFTFVPYFLILMDLVSNSNMRIVSIIFLFVKVASYGYHHFH